MESLKVSFNGDGFNPDSIKIYWPGQGTQHLNFNSASAENSLVRDIIKQNIDSIRTDRKLPKRLKTRMNNVVTRAKKQGHTLRLYEGTEMKLTEEALREMIRKELKEGFDDYPDYSDWEKGETRDWKVFHKWFPEIDQRIIKNMDVRSITIAVGPKGGAYDAKSTGIKHLTYKK